MNGLRGTSTGHTDPRSRESTEEVLVVIVSMRRFGSGRFWLSVWFSPLLLGERSGSDSFTRVSGTGFKTRYHPITRGGLWG